MPAKYHVETKLPKSATWLRCASSDDLEEAKEEFAGFVRRSRGKDTWRLVEVLELKEQPASGKP